MKDALWPLSRNVVSANPARPSGAGSAAGVLSTTVTDRSEDIALIQPSLDLAGDGERTPRSAPRRRSVEETLADASPARQGRVLAAAGWAPRGARLRPTARGRTGSR